MEHCSDRFPNATAVNNEACQYQDYCLSSYVLLTYLNRHREPCLKN